MYSQSAHGSFPCHVPASSLSVCETVFTAIINIAAEIKERYFILNPFIPLLFQNLNSFGICMFLNPEMFTIVYIIFLRSYLCLLSRVKYIVMGIIRLNRTEIKNMDKKSTVLTAEELYNLLYK